MTNMNHATDTSAPSTDRFRAWLDAGREFFPGAAFERLHAVAVELLSAEREALLGRARDLDARLSVLKADGPVAEARDDISFVVPIFDSPGKSTVVVAQVKTTRGEDVLTWSVRSTVQRVVDRSPGCTAPEIVELVRHALPQSDAGTVFSTLNKLTRRGLLRQEGERGSYRYYPNASSEVPRSNLIPHGGTPASALMGGRHPSPLTGHGGSEGGDPV